MSRVFLHMDMDAFFASVEELANPSIRGKPLVITGPGKRSIITTASYPARKYGVRTGMTVNQAKALCMNIITVRSDFTKYADASKRVMAVLESFSPEVFVTSVDEACLEVTSLLRRYSSPAHLGLEVKEKVSRKTGLTCSVGMAPNRLLAKLASTLNKPDGLAVLSPEEVKPLLEVTPVENMCGIGPVTTRALNGLGIRTCGQLGRYPESLLRHRFGSYGKKLSLMGRGGEETPVDGGMGGSRENRSIGHSVTLPLDITGLDEMKMVLQTLAEMVGRRARRNGFRARTLTLTWRYNDFSTHSHGSGFPSPICLTEEIYRSSLRLLYGIDIIKPVRLLGLSLSNLSRGEYTPDLFLKGSKKERVQETLDGINDRFGEFTLAYGNAMQDLGTLNVISPSWRPRGGRKSV